MSIEIFVTKEEHEKIKELRKQFKGDERKQKIKELFLNREGDILRALGVPDLLNIDGGGWHPWEYPEKFLQKNLAEGFDNYLRHLYYSPTQEQLGRYCEGELISGETVKYTEMNVKKIEDHKRRFPDSEYLGIGKFTKSFKIKLGYL